MRELAHFVGLVWIAPLWTFRTNKLNDAQLYSLKNYWTDKKMSYLRSSLSYKISTKKNSGIKFDYTLYIQCYGYISEKAR